MIVALMVVATNVASPPVIPIVFPEITVKGDAADSEVEEEIFEMLCYVHGMISWDW